MTIINLNYNKLNLILNMKFATIALIATASAVVNPGRDRIVGETCVKAEDRCVNNITDKTESANLKCCNLKITLISTSKTSLVCIDTGDLQVDVNGIQYGYNCDYVENGAMKMAMSATVAAISALYLAA